MTSFGTAFALWFFVAICTWGALLAVVRAIIEICYDHRRIATALSVTSYVVWVVGCLWLADALFYP